MFLPIGSRLENASVIRENFLRVLNEYKSASQEPYADHPLANFIRRDLPQVFEGVLPSGSRYQTKASPGLQVWTNVLG